MVKETGQLYHKIEKRTEIVPGVKGCHVQPIITANIPSQTSRRHTSSSIPLRHLHSQTRISSAASGDVGQSAAEGESRRRSSLSSANSEFVWTDSGDLAEQPADAEHPLQTNLSNRPELDTSYPIGSQDRPKQPKRIRILHQPYIGSLATEKTSIEIPQPLPRRISRAERILATIMSPNNRQNAQMHGLVGKPLL